MPDNEGWTKSSEYAKCFSHTLYTFGIERRPFRAAFLRLGDLTSRRVMEQIARTDEKSRPRRAGPGLIRFPARKVSAPAIIARVSIYRSSSMTTNRRATLKAC